MVSRRRLVLHGCQVHRPEFVLRFGEDALERYPCVGHTRTVRELRMCADSQKGKLGLCTRREWFDPQPLVGRVVMRMCAPAEGDEHVRVQQPDHTSSSNSLTSSGTNGG